MQKLSCITLVKRLEQYMANIDELNTAIQRSLKKHMPFNYKLNLSNKTFLLLIGKTKFTLKKLSLE